ncbi:MAG: FtsH protease activity modulator HflK [Pseudomonas fluorescens]|nr:MAG: FtsH protease activity modulator HflK [Pseudomonas fluorescens]
MKSSKFFSGNVFAWDNGQGPWGKPNPHKAPKPKAEPQRPYAGRDTTPSSQPDLEDVVNQMAEKLRGFWRNGNNGGNGSGTGPMGVGFEWWGLGFLMLWLASGLYIVAPEEQGVVTRFGAYVKTSDSGLNYRLPWPIEKVTKLPVTRVNQLEIGFRSGEGRMEPIDVAAESLMLTGDQNIVDLDFTVNWKIANPSAFLFNVADPAGTLVDVAESVMRETIGRHPIDDALTSNKAAIQHEARAQMQRVLNSYKMGIAIVNVSLQRVNPPSEVIEAFRDVQAANADKQRLINEARGYANQIVPLARGEAAKMLEQAEGYKSAKVAEATGAAQRFNAQVNAYQQAPAVTRDRLYYETMQDVMSNTQKVVTTSRSANGVLPFLPLDRMLKPNAAVAPAAGPQQ